MFLKCFFHVLLISDIKQGREIAILSQYLALSQCCERCERQVLSTRLSADIWLSIDD